MKGGRYRVGRCARVPNVSKVFQIVKNVSFFCDLRRNAGTSVTGKLQKETNQASAAQLPTRTHRKSGKPSFRLWPSRSPIQFAGGF